MTDLPEADLAKVDTTSLALDRTVLANERTYAAWIRTGLATLVTALAIARFMVDSLPLWSVHLITAFLLFFSATAFILAAWRYESLHLGMSHLDVKLLPLGLVKLLSYMLAACSLLSVIGLLYM